MIEIHPNFVTFLSTCLKTLPTDDSQCFDKLISFQIKCISRYALRFVLQLLPMIVMLKEGVLGGDS